jgi:hypothetical protein
VELGFPLESFPAADCVRTSTGIYSVRPCYTWGTAAPTHVPGSPLVVLARSRPCYIFGEGSICCCRNMANSYPRPPAFAPHVVLTQCNPRSSHVVKPCTTLAPSDRHFNYLGSICVNPQYGATHPRGPLESEHAVGLEYLRWLLYHRALVALVRYPLTTVPPSLNNPPPLYELFLSSAHSFCDVWKAGLHRNTRAG